MRWSYHCQSFSLSCAGQRLSSEDMSSALNMYNEIMDDTLQCNSEEPRWTSVGHFMRAEVLNMSGLFLMMTQKFLQWLIV